jgi:hypothetical protein
MITRTDLQILHMRTTTPGSVDELVGVPDTATASLLVAPKSS